MKTILQSLDTIAYALSRHPDIDAIVEALTEAERIQFNKGVETVAMLKSALDETAHVVRFPNARSLTSS